MELVTTSPEVVVDFPSTPWAEAFSAEDDAGWCALPFGCWADARFGSDVAVGARVKYE